MTSDLGLHLELFTALPSTSLPTLSLSKSFLPFCIYRQIKKSSAILTLILIHRFDGTWLDRGQISGLCCLTVYVVLLLISTPKRSSQIRYSYSLWMFLWKAFETLPSKVNELMNPFENISQWWRYYRIVWNVRETFYIHALLTNVQCHVIWCISPLSIPAARSRAVSSAATSVGNIVS